MGLSSEDGVTHFADYDWEILEHIKDPFQLTLIQHFDFSQMA